jgi:hypothetical protein
MYRLPCRTEYNDEFNADYNAEYNADYNAENNTEHNAISVSRYITENTRELDPESDSAIQSYTTTMTIDDCNRLLN